MSIQIQQATWVLVYFDALYHARFHRSGPPNEGRGGAYEGALITAELYQMSTRNEKFIPILSDGASDELIPVILSGYNRYYIPKDIDLLATSLLASATGQGAIQYPGVYSMCGYQVPFVPTLNRDGILRKTFKYHEIRVTKKSWAFRLPKAFIRTQIPDNYDNLVGCRLDQHQIGDGMLDFEFSRVMYADYLKSGEHLDDPVPDEPQRTFRDLFGQLVVSLQDVTLRTFALTNICGVGTFIVSQDKDILITRHSERSHVYPRRWTFSSSGTMRWGASPNPFTEAIWKCRQETNHQIDLARFSLVEVGADTRKLFFECCFVEESDATSQEIRHGLPPTLDWDLIPLSPVNAIIRKIMENCWEPAAEAVLLMLCMRHHGREATERALNQLRSEWKQHQMLDEWDLRACRRGSLAVMSVRYPPRQVEKESSRYVRAILDFLGDSVKDRVVLEVGSGIGRITRALAKKARRVVCVDLCERMHFRNQSELGNLAKKVSFSSQFIQHFRSSKHFDVVVCSLVLIHNVSDEDFGDAVRVMCESAETVFAFEDVSTGRKTSPHTHLRDVSELTAKFAECGYKLDRDEYFDLFDDKIAFLKFVRMDKV